MNKLKRLEASSPDICLDQQRMEPTGGELIYNLCVRGSSAEDQTNWQRQQDAFSQKWDHLKEYTNPPWCLVGRVLNHAKNQKAQLISLEGPALGLNSTRDAVRLLKWQGWFTQQGCNHISGPTSNVANFLADSFSGL